MQDNELRDMIIKKLKFMVWRKDFERWIENRIKQEIVQAKRINALESILGSLKNKLILDLGCGMGGFVVAANLREILTIGLDIDIENLKITRIRGLKYDFTPDIVLGIGEMLPFKDNCFDVIVMFDVIEHVNNPELVIKDVSRTLKNNGYFYVNAISRYILKDPHYHLYFINFLPRPLAEFYIKLRKHTKPYNKFLDKQKLSDLHYFTLEGFKKIIRNHLKIVKSTGDKIYKPETINNGTVRLIIKFLNKIRLTFLIFWLLHVYPGTFFVVARKG